MILDIAIKEAYNNLVNDFVQSGAAQNFEEAVFFAKQTAESEAERRANFATFSAQQRKSEKEKEADKIISEISPFLEILNTANPSRGDMLKFLEDPTAKAPKGILKSFAASKNVADAVFEEVFKLGSLDRDSLSDFLAELNNEYDIKYIIGRAGIAGQRKIYKSIQQLSKDSINKFSSFDEIRFFYENEFKGSERFLPPLSNYIDRIDPVETAEISTRTTADATSALIYPLVEAAKSLYSFIAKYSKTAAKIIQICSLVFVGQFDKKKETSGRDAPQKILEELADECIAIFPRVPSEGSPVISGNSGIYGDEQKRIILGVRMFVQ